METLLQELKSKIIEVLELDLTPEEIADTRPLFGENGLGLDSVDVLEIVAMLQMDFNVDIPDQEAATKILVNLRTIAEYVQESR